MDRGKTSVGFRPGRHVTHASRRATFAYGTLAGALTVSALLATAATVVARGDARAELTIGEVYERARTGIVRVDVVPGAGHASFGAPPDRDVSSPSGSGFVYDGLGRIVTSLHVVSGASAIHVRLDDGEVLPARLVAGDPSTDVAVLDVELGKGTLGSLTMGDSSGVAIGEPVVAIGSPFGLESSVTSGIVSAVGRSIRSPDNSQVVGAIQTDAAINRGNSGGPLLDMRGNVVGLVAQFESASGGSNGVGLAVPSNTVSAVVRRLLARGAAAN
jgi:putative serine protease PepD